MHDTSRIQESLRHAVACGPADREKAQRLIGTLYRHYGYPIPKFRWSDNPVQHSAAISEKLSFWLGDRKGNSISEELLDVDIEIPSNGQFTLMMQRLVGIYNVLRARMWDSGITSDTTLWNTPHGVERLMRPVMAAAIGRHHHDLYMDIIKEVPIFVAYKKVCYLCDRPASVFLNNQYRLHHPRGQPAIVYKEMEVHAWDGEYIPFQIARQVPRNGPDLMNRLSETTNHILASFMVEQYGIDRAVREYVARRYGSTPHGNLIIFIPNRPDSIREFVGKMVYLEVENATALKDGTREVFYIRVPPTMLDATEAVAWTFGMSACEYKASLYAES